MILTERPRNHVSPATGYDHLRGQRGGARMLTSEPTIGTLVLAVEDIWQDADDDSPLLLLANKGQILEVRRIGICFPHGTWPLYVGHPHREPEAMFGVELREIRLYTASEPPKPKQKNFDLDGGC